MKVKFQLFTPGKELVRQWYDFLYSNNQKTDVANSRVSPKTIIFFFHRLNNFYLAIKVQVGIGNCAEEVLQYIRLTVTKSEVCTTYSTVLGNEPTTFLN